MHRLTSLGRGLVVLGVVGLLLAPAGARAQSAGREFGLGATCALGNLLYGPVKLLYASGGALIAGMAWAFSGGDEEVAGPILDASVRGDYVIMPSHLQGRRDLEFVGRRPDHERARGDDAYRGGGGLERGGAPVRPEPDSLDEGF